MPELPATTTSVGHPAHKPAGFPPFKTETYPSQIFWLAITFGFLFVVLWRSAGPMISGTLAARRAHINKDLAEARKARGDADAALAAYEAAVAGARTRAAALAEENRKKVSDEIDRSRVEANQSAAAQLAQVEKQIEETRRAARIHIARAAEEAAAAIVERLIGETVTTGEAAQAVRAAIAS